MCSGCCVQVSICYVAPVVIVPLLGFPACFPNVKELGAVAADKFVNHILGVTIDRRLDFPGLSRSVILVWDYITVALPPVIQQDSGIQQSQDSFSKGTGGNL